MAGPKLVRTRAKALPWLRALVFLAASFTAFGALPFYPAAVRPLLAIACGALGLFAPAIGVLVIVLALTLPLAAGNFLVGGLFLLIGLVSVSYFGQDGSRAFVVVALAFLAVIAHAEWALAPLAGYLLGASEGVVVSVVAVVLLEAAAITLGRPALGTVAGGGAKALLDLAALASLKDPLSFGWVAAAVAKLDVDATLKVLGGIRYFALLAVQPVLWGVAAMLSGTLAKREAPVRSVVAVAGTSVILSAASYGAMSALHGPVTAATLGASAVLSLVVAAAVAAIAAWVFPLVPMPGLQSRSPQEEDADVDQLLRTIASAEEALEERHAADAVVLITDMKSFSRMTQEQGSLATAKAIQKHRDLLLPLIAECRGRGKSTGGDGLLAAFASADDAVKATVKMQQALKRYNLKKPAEKQILVRMGLASGEVVVDKAGCPFIGDALNIAARVMSLADGGQVFAASDVVDAAATLPSPVVSHGSFSLKNIARPVDVFEVLWDEGQQPRRPETEPTAA